jgi:hypothetical protein
MIIGVNKNIFLIMFHKKMTNFVADYFINVIEFMPIEQLVPCRLVCRAIDKFIAQMSYAQYKIPYAPRDYILRNCGEIFNNDTAFTINNHGIYYWHDGKFDWLVYGFDESDRNFYIYLNAEILYWNGSIVMPKYKISRPILQIIDIIENQKYE